MMIRKASELLNWVDSLIEAKAQRAMMRGEDAFHVENVNDIVATLVPDGDSDRIVCVWTSLTSYIEDVQTVYRYRFLAKRDEDRLKAFPDIPDLLELKEMVEADMRRNRKYCAYAEVRCKTSRELLMRAMVD